ncbi:MAG: DinB family protein [Terriglobia bacterium]
MKHNAPPSHLKLPLRLIDEAYDQAAWHGPNLRGSLRGVTAGAAAWRPGPGRPAIRTGRHNIWEIVVHAAYWKYVVRRRIRGEKRGSFALRGSNWFRRPLALTEKAWRQDVALLEQEHVRLRAAVAALSQAELNRRAAKGKTSIATLVHGIAFHDVYHAGQIRLLRRLLPTGKRR